MYVLAYVGILVVRALKLFTYVHLLGVHARIATLYTCEIYVKLFVYVCYVHVLVDQQLLL